MTEPTLYILMRSDMDSMNPGKAMAQAAHAANAFIHSCGMMHRPPFSEDMAKAVDEWQSSTDQGFGTTITLEVDSEDKLKRLIHLAQADGLPAEVIHDPSYPIRDGRVTHLLPINTCGYVFTPCRVTQNVTALSSLTLHP